MRTRKKKLHIKQVVVFYYKGSHWLEICGTENLIYKLFIYSLCVVTMLEKNQLKGEILSKYCHHIEKLYKIAFLKKKKQLNLTKSILLGLSDIDIKNSKFQYFKSNKIIYLTFTVKLYVTKCYF